MPPLGDFLKRVDSNIKTASDYAILNGNIELYEEFNKTLNKSSGDALIHEIKHKLSKFVVNDKLAASLSANSADYSKDAELFLKKFDALSTTNGNKSHEKENDYFIVDPLSNMNKIGYLVWDQTANVPYDVIITKTDVSYGLYGMHNFYKMQLITHSFNHHNLKAKSQNNSDAHVPVKENN